jgi:hypothetical protein
LTKTDRFPWSKTGYGESFFVPTLDVRKVELEGRQAATRVLGTRANVKAVPCVYKGLLGVMFTKR